MNMERTPLFLMANLGSEVSRLLSFRERGDSAEVEKSYQRSERMLDQLVAFSEMESRRPEMTILKDVIKDFSVSHKKQTVRSEDLQNYFTPFATRLFSTRNKPSGPLV